MIQDSQYYLMTKGHAMLTFLCNKTLNDVRQRWSCFFRIDFAVGSVLFGSVLSMLKAHHFHDFSHLSLPCTLACLEFRNFKNFQIMICNLKFHKCVTSFLLSKSFYIVYILWLSRNGSNRVIVNTKRCKYAFTTQHKP